MAITQTPCFANCLNLIRHDFLHNNRNKEHIMQGHENSINKTKAEIHILYVRYH